jgi:hypothetical protein
MPLGVDIGILLAEAPRPLTREIFGNMPRAAQSLFYVVAAATVGLLLSGVLSRVRFRLRGRERADRRVEQDCVDEIVDSGAATFPSRVHSASSC